MIGGSKGKRGGKARRDDEEGEEKKREKKKLKTTVRGDAGKGGRQHLEGAVKHGQE